jgi:DNA-binding MarR family transcriptional regulator
MPEAPPFSPSVTLLALAGVWEAALADALKPCGLTLRKMALLGHIRASPGVSFSELARRSRITVQSAHAATAALVAAGWVDDATAHAGSASTLQVTADGEAVLDEAAAAVDRVDRVLAAQHPDLDDVLRRHVEDRRGGRD